MRVLESEAGLSGAFGVMDAFAALRSGAGSDPAFGGYLVLRPRTLRRQRLRASAFLLGAARRIGSLMLVLLASGLGVAALAAIAVCPTCDFGASSPRLARLAYADQAPLVAQDIATSGIFAAMVIDPAEAKDAPVDAFMEASPISTSAITPLRETPRPLTGQPADPLTGEVPRRGPRQTTYDWLSSPDTLPSKIEPMRDAGPKPLRVASASPADDGPGFGLPELALAAPATELHAVAVEREDDAEPARATRKERPWKRYSKRAKARSNFGSTVATGTGPLAKKHRMPRWAQQMYDNPWQSTAFAYTR